MFREPRIPAGTIEAPEFPGFLQRPDGIFVKLHRNPRTGNQKQIMHKRRTCTHCGTPVLVHYTNAERNAWFACSAACRRLLRSKKDGATKRKRGNLGGPTMVKAAQHPAAVAGYVPEHRLIMEQQVGRILSRVEVVHHINMDEQDNSPENLFLCATSREHFLIHGSLNECVKELMLRGHLVFDEAAKRYAVPAAQPVRHQRGETGRAAA